MFTHSKRTLALVASVVALSLIWGLSVAAPPEGKGKPPTNGGGCTAIDENDPTDTRERRVDVLRDGVHAFFAESIKCALELLPATLDGDYVIEIEPGIYNEVVVIDKANQFDGSGTPLHLLTVRAAIAWTVIINGGIFVQAPANNVTVEDLDVTGASIGIDLQPYAADGTRPGLHNITIKGCRLFSTNANDPEMRTGIHLRGGRLTLFYGLTGTPFMMSLAASRSWGARR